MAEDEPLKGGRPRTLKEPVQISIQIEASQLARLELYSVREKMNRVEAIRRAIDLLLPPVEKRE